MNLDLDAIRTQVGQIDRVLRHTLDCEEPHDESDHHEAGLINALSCAETIMRDLLAEVERLRAEPTQSLRDADGTVWVYAGQAYRVDSDDRNAPTLVLRTEIEADWGPVTEVTS